jgi:hypothetical protein
MTPEQIKRLQDKLTVAQTDLYYTKQAKIKPPRLKKEKLQEAEEEVAFYEEVLKMSKREIEELTK